MSIIADYIFYGGDIITMDDNTPTAEALAVQNDTIVGVGCLEEILKMKGDATQLVYLNNQSLLPGLIEPHQHAIQMILCRCLYVNISGYYYTKYEETESIILSTISKLETPDQWVIFFGWDPEIVSNMPILSADFISKKYSSTNPVVIVGQSGHVGWANMKAFKAAEIPDDVENPTGGTFVRDEQGNLTGQFFEEPALMMILGKAPPPNEQELAQALKDQWREYAEAGITTTVDMGYIPNEGFDFMLEVASKQDTCPLRLGLYEVVHPEEEDTRKCVGCCLNASSLVKLKKTKQFKIGSWSDNSFLWKAGVKIIGDGSPHAGTAAVREPYLKSNLTEILGFPEAPCYGFLNFSTKDIEEMINTHHSAGKQIAVHCHGERTCDQVISAFEKILQNASPTSDFRHRMEHVGLITEEQIKRAAKLNLGLSFFVNHLYFYGVAYNNSIFGPERTRRWAPCGLGSKYGVCWTLHQDHATHPGPPLPFISMRSAITRTDRTDPDVSYGPEYCVSIHEALKAYTTNAAWQLCLDKEIGSLTVNKKADLLVISENPYKCDPFKLEDIDVIETFVNGRMNNISCLVDQGLNGTKVFKKKA